MDYDKDEHRDQFKKKRDKKKGGKSNKEKERSKPFMMVKQKKIHDMNEKFNTVKKKIKGLKVQLGKFKKNTK